MGFGTKKILKDSSDWVMSKTLLPISSTATRWNFISSGAGKFVSGANRSYDSIYSESPREFNLSTIPLVFYVTSITYGKGVFVAVGNQGEYAYSNDGQTWNAYEFGLGVGASSVTYGKGRFVAVGGLGAAYSNDGINWTQASIPAPPAPANPSLQNYNNVAYGNGIFVAISSYRTTSGGINYTVSAVSQDGINWQSYTINIGAQAWVSNSIAFGNGKFIAVPFNTTTSTSRRILESANGISWGFSALSLPFSGYYRITYGSGNFCTINITSGTSCYFSTDGGIYFNSVKKRDHLAYGIGYGYGKFVIIGENRVSYTRSNKLQSSFESNSILPSSSNWNCHAYGRGIHVLISSSLGRTAYNNGSWNAGTIQQKVWNDVKYGGGIFVAVSSDSNGISYSSNGTSWTSVTNSATSRLSVTYGGGSFACIGSTNQLIHSANGSSWTSVTLPSTSWKNIKYGLGRFVVIKNGTSFIYSSNLTNWTTITVPNGNWGKLQYGNGTFVAFSETQSNQFIYSKDGINWITGNLPRNFTILTFSYGGGIFIAIPSNDRAIFSYDGINWIDGINYNYSSGDSDIRTIGYGHGYFYAPVYGTNRLLSLYPEIFRQSNVSVMV
jgi:hypothetical protein